MIEQQSNGRWKVTVELPQPDGTRRRICRTVDTEDQAERLQGQLRARPTEAVGQTVGSAVERYMMLHGPAMAPNTERSRTSAVRTQIASCWIAAVRLDQLDVETLETYYVQLQRGTYKPHAEPLAYNTARATRRLIHAALGDVVRARWILPEQYQGARVIGRDESEAALDDDYDVDEIARALAAGASFPVPDVDLADVVQLALATGARKSELAGIRWGNDVDLESGLVRVQGSISRNRPGEKSGYHRRTTKTRKKRRPILVDDACLAMLQRRYVAQTEAAIAAGVESLDGLAVLSRTLERDYTSPEALGMRWQRAASAAGVALRFHDLRHVNTSEQIAAGVSDVNVAARNGWQSTVELHRTYAHARAVVDPLAVAALGDVWRRIEAHRTL